jgi:hypothetical protein
VNACECVSKISAETEFLNSFRYERNILKFSGGHDTGNVTYWTIRVLFAAGTCHGGVVAYFMQSVCVGSSARAVQVAGLEATSDRGSW